MRGLQVYLLAALCIAAKAGYISYAKYGLYPGYAVYGGNHGLPTSGNSAGYSGYSGYEGSEYYAYPKYSYDYSVNDPYTGDFKTKWETREGDVVKGAYSVADPDGTTRIVEYTADKHNGFNAVVKKVGHAYHPQFHTSNYRSGYHRYH